MKRFPIIPVLFLSISLFFSCNKDEVPVENPIAQEEPDEKPEEPEEPEEPVSEVFFTLNIDSDYFISIFREGYIIIHDTDGVLLDFKKYASGDNQLKFETEPGITVTDKITVTQFMYTELGGGSDFYTIQTFPQIEKGTTWDFKSVPSTYNPDGEFDIAVNNVPGWNYYNISNKNSFGSSVSRYYRFLNDSNPDTSFIEAGSDWFPNNDYFMSVIDGNLDLKYLELPDMQQADSLVVDYSDFSSFDTYLDVTLPEYEAFNHRVMGYETEQDFVFGGLTLNESREYAFPEEVNSISLGYLNRFSKFRTSISITSDAYQYEVSYYGAKPNAISIPSKSTLSVTDPALRSFNFETELVSKRQRAIWSTKRNFLDPDFSSTSWFVYGPDLNQVEVPELPEEIILQYTNLDLDLLEHESIKIFTQSDSYEAFLKRRLRETKISSGYVEETMLYGETR